MFAIVVQFCIGGRLSGSGDFVFDDGEVMIFESRGAAWRFVGTNIRPYLRKDDVVSVVDAASA